MVHICKVLYHLAALKCHKIAMHGVSGCEAGAPLQRAWVRSAACVAQGPVGVSNKHVETAIDEASGKLTMLYQVKSARTAMPCSASWYRKSMQGF